VVEDFERLYEQRYGKGSAYRDAGMEMTQFRVTAKGIMDRPALTETFPGNGNADDALLGRRPIFVDDANGFVDAPIYAFDALETGQVIEGPAVIHTPVTTIVLQAGQTGRINIYRNTIINF
jgi:N-methylhydantoinase A